jgi:hypothetical protein
MQVLLNILDILPHHDGQRVLHVIDATFELEVFRRGDRYAVTLFQLNAAGERACTRAYNQGIETTEEARLVAREMCQAAIDQPYLERSN